MFGVRFGFVFGFGFGLRTDLARYTLKENIVGGETVKEGVDPPGLEQLR